MEVHKRNYVNKNLSQFDKQRESAKERTFGEIPLGFPLIKLLAYSQRLSMTGLIAFSGWIKVNT